MKQKMISAHMKAAEVYSQLSTAKKLQVGAIVVKDDRIISIGYNGMPPGDSNVCEDKFMIDTEHLLNKEEIEKQYPWQDYLPETGRMVRYKLVTKPEVIHAEANAIAKLAKSTESGLGSTMFITHSPCMECSKLILTAGIERVFYKNEYRSKDGIEFLQKHGITIERVE